MTVAEAEREAEILRGQGDAERSRVFAEAYQRDTGFFEFYRSMRAYELALDGTGTTLILSPDSEFLRFFTDASGRATGGGPLAAPPAPAPAGAGETPAAGATDAPQSTGSAPAVEPAPASEAPAPSPRQPRRNERGCDGDRAGLGSGGGALRALSRLMKRMAEQVTAIARRHAPGRGRSICGARRCAGMVGARLKQL